MPDLTIGQMQTMGVVITGQTMDNGENRFRLMVGGSGYIWTEPPTDDMPSWQNAHYHKGVMETYIVERGAMAMAIDEFNGTPRHVVLLHAGDVITTIPKQAHNVYLFAGSAIHTVKHGTAIGDPEKGGADWWAADPGFDAWTKSLTEADIKGMTGH